MDGRSATGELSDGKRLLVRVSERSCGPLGASIERHLLTVALRGQSFTKRPPHLSEPEVYPLR